MTLSRPNIKKIESKKDIDGLLRIFTGDEYHGDTRAALDHALVRMGAPVVEPLVIALARWKKEPHGEHAELDELLLHWHAVEILKKMDTAQLRPLTGLIRSGEVDVRSQAIELAGDLEYKKATDALMEALNDPTVQAAAALALIRIPDKRAVNGLLKVIETGTELARENAAYALGQFQLDEHIPLLKKLLDDRAPGVRAAAVHWIGETKDPSHLPFVARLLDDADASAREEAAEAIGKLGGKDYFQRLERLINDDEVNVRKKAAETMGRLDRKRAKAAIADAAGYDFGKTRHQSFEWFDWWTAAICSYVGACLGIALVHGLSEYPEFISMVPSNNLFLNYYLFFIMFFIVCYVLFYFPLWYSFDYRYRHDVDVVFRMLYFEDEIMLDILERELKKSYSVKKTGEDLDTLDMVIKLDENRTRSISITHSMQIDKSGIEITHYKKLPGPEQKRLLSIITDAAIESFMTPEPDG